MFPKMILIKEYILDTAFLKTKEKQRQEGPAESPRGAIPVSRFLPTFACPACMLYHSSSLSFGASHLSHT